MSPSSSHTRVIRPSSGRAAASLGMAALLAAACGSERIEYVPEPVRAVEGGKVADREKPRVQWGAYQPHELRPSRARFCERFVTERPQEVDLLLVVGGGADMSEEREALAASLGSLFEGLASRPPLDFRIGILSTDADRPSVTGGYAGGHLLQIPGAPERWISCSATTARVRCDVGSGSEAEAIAALRSLLLTLRDGPGDKGLLAASLALSPPLLVDGANRGFLRQDAALSVLFVADEDDGSCGPWIEADRCLAEPACRCDNPPIWGSVAHFGRFFRGLKGSGREAAVRVDALVATENVHEFRSDNGRTYLGCNIDDGAPCTTGGAEGACALAAPRYAAVAEAAGGRALDLCSLDLSEALAFVGRGAAGERTEFPLSRRPVPGTIDVVEVPPGAVLCNDALPCSETHPLCLDGRCVRRMTEGLPEGWEAVICSGGTVSNAVRFGGRSKPEPSSTIEICFDVETDLGCASE